MLPGGREGGRKVREEREWRVKQEGERIRREDVLATALPKKLFYRDRPLRAVPMAINKVVSIPNK
jgi:hypothetical protein